MPRRVAGSVCRNGVLVRRLHCRRDVGAAATSVEKEVEGVEEQKSTTAGYPFQEIEAKWQAYWEENKTFRTPEDVDMSKPKFYVLDMFPYPRYVGSDEGEGCAGG